MKTKQKCPTCRGPLTFEGNYILEKQRSKEVRPVARFGCRKHKPGYSVFVTRPEDQVAL